MAGRDLVLVASVRRGYSPRLGGEDEEHVRRLAECDAAVLPPIVVHRPSMRVIDGMHRLRVAQLQGRDRIEAVFFDGSEEEAFARAVELNVAHGLPLSLPDRKAAAARILTWRPQLSDRAVAAMSGLSPKTVGAVRARAREEIPQVHERVGSDGKSYRLDRAEGRSRAAQALAARPGASLREVAASAGVSAGTVRRVRELLRGDEGSPAAGQRRPGGAVPEGMSRGRAAAAPGARPVLEKLCKDPSLRHSEAGRALLRWLDGHSVDPGQWDGLSRAVPPHCVPLIIVLAQQNASAWQELAARLKGRPGPGADPAGRPGSAGAAPGRRS